MDDSIPVDLGVDRIRHRVLSPVDLPVSKIARFADNDKEDIAALVRLGLTTADENEHRASSALDGYVVGQAVAHQFGRHLSIFRARRMPRACTSTLPRSS
jgi:hypothetical protein